MVLNDPLNILNGNPDPFGELIAYLTILGVY